jgi:hypothetical protein
MRQRIGRDLHSEAQADHRQQRGGRAVVAQHEQALDGVEVRREVARAEQVGHYGAQHDGWQ